MASEETSEEFPPLGDDQVTERLVNLVMLLTSSRYGFTKVEIAERVPGYSDSAAAMERMFERDKRILAVNNINLSEPNNDDDYRYKISLKTATLPELQFTTKEQEILRAATLAWENTSQRADAVLLQTKLESIGITGTANKSIANFDLPLDLESVFSALSEKRILKFEYRRPEQADTTKRELEIWGVAVRYGSWFIYGKDRIRDAVRVFNLFRVEGSFSISGEASSYEIQTVDLNELLDPSNRDDISYQVTLEVAQGKGEYWRDLAGLSDLDASARTLSVLLDNPLEQISRLAADAPGVVVKAPKEVIHLVSNLVWGNYE
jgi:predicted DNA-binding transcriptional regulator YafY